jgi:hypothetical protein
LVRLRPDQVDDTQDIVVADPLAVVHLAEGSADLEDDPLVGEEQEEDDKRTLIDIFRSYNTIYTYAYIRAI